MDREVEIIYDNDLYYGSDRYYTSGSNAAYSRLIKSRSKFYRQFRSKRSDSLKVITRYHYGHQIYTPDGIRSIDFEQFDRPYAGWHYLRFQTLNFPGENTANKYGIELGLVGSMSGVGNFQQWWHEAFGILQPRGWEYEIRNEVVMNLSYNRIKNWKLAKKIKIMTNSAIQLGNGKNKVGQEVLLRLGKFNDIMNSAIINSRVSDLIPKIGVYPGDGEEGFAFFSINADYVLSDILIEGSLFNDDSPHTEEINHLVFTQKIGFVYSNYYTTFSFTAYRIGEEVVGGRIHRYLSLSLAFRF
nr:lipid A deacylase LpxR family protein [Fulvivirga sp. M361]